VDNPYNLLNSAIEGTCQFLTGRNLYGVTSVAMEKTRLFVLVCQLNVPASQMVDVQGISFCVGAALRHHPMKICPAE
jgi:hypothetical protein